MVEALLGQSGLPAAIRARVTAAAEGNPLFVEQLVSMLVDEGTDPAGEAGGSPTTPEYRHPAHHPGAPRGPSRPAGPGRARGHRAGVRHRPPVPGVGAALLAPEPFARRLPAHLATLDRKQFVHPAESGVDGEATSGSITSSSGTPPTTACSSGPAQPPRALRGVGGRARTPSGSEASSSLEILGYHLEQAHRYLARARAARRARHRARCPRLRPPRRGRPASLRPGRHARDGQPAASRAARAARR